MRAARNGCYTNDESQTGEWNPRTPLTGRRLDPSRDDWRATLAKPVGEARREGGTFRRSHAFGPQNCAALVHGRGDDRGRFRMREPSASGPQDCASPDEVVARGIVQSGSPAGGPAMLRWSGSRDLHPHDQGGGLSCCCYIRATLDLSNRSSIRALSRAAREARGPLVHVEHPPPQSAPPGRRADCRLGWGPRVGA